MVSSYNGLVADPQFCSCSVPLAFNAQTTLGIKCSFINQQMKDVVIVGTWRHG